MLAKNELARGHAMQAPQNASLRDADDETIGLGCLVRLAVPRNCCDQKQILFTVTRLKGGLGGQKLRGTDRIRDLGLVKLRFLIPIVVGLEDLEGRHIGAINLRQVAFRQEIGQNIGLQRLVSDLEPAKLGVDLVGRNARGLEVRLERPSQVLLQKKTNQGRGRRPRSPGMPQIDGGSLKSSRLS